MERLRRPDPGPDTVHWGYFDAALPPRLGGSEGVHAMAARELFK
jgi:hypothetical protein